MLTIVGVLIMLMGIIGILIGDKSVGQNGGVVLRVFSMPEGHAKWMKWLLGGALILGGVMIVINA